MGSRFVHVCALLIACLIPPPAQANDSFARVGAGGLTLIKNQQVRMLEEVLEISTKSIRVNYRFLNESQHDIKATVAFPTPPQFFARTECEGVPDDYFDITVDGKVVRSKVELRAKMAGHDVTHALRLLGLTDKQLFSRSRACWDMPDVLDTLTRTQKTAINLLAKAWRADQRWDIVATYYWDQVFPAGREVKVQHQYDPHAGSIYVNPTSSSPFDITNVPTASTVGTEEIRKLSEACVDEAIVSAIASRAKEVGLGKSARWVTVSLADVEYILGTGRNWKGPIGKFTLRIKKDSADQIVSLCFPGKPKKIDPLTIEFSERNFTPQDKLIIYYYSVGASIHIKPATIFTEAPESVSVRHTIEISGGMAITGFADSIDSVNQYIRNLTQAGLSSVRLIASRHVTACEVPWLQFKLEIPGNPGNFGRPTPLPELAAITVRKEGQLQRCITPFQPL